MKFLKSEITHGGIGITVGVAGLSVVQHVNEWLHTLQLALTIAISVATLVSIVRKLRGK